MSGMGSGLRTDDHLVVAAFHHALEQQLLVVLLIGAALWVLRSVLPSRLSNKSEAGGPGRRFAAEPIARRVLRIGFGLVWLLDGLLQAQSAMPLSLPSQVLTPSASTSPAWVQHLVSFAGTIWLEHPVTAAAAAVWIQVGIGLMLLAVPAGRWSRFAGATSAVWGLLVWVFGEAFGGIFAPGVTWLFGAPGAVLFYVIAGVLIALPARAWSTPTLGRWLLRAAGLFLAGMALLQAWPGRGFWQGQTRPHHAPGTLVSMVRSMAQSSQPGVFRTALHGFTQFDAAHGWAVNLFTVVALAVVGLGLPRTARPSPAGPSSAAWSSASPIGSSSKTWDSSGASAPTRTA